MQQVITFDVLGTTYTATLWNKVEGKERYYVKSPKGSDCGFVVAATGEWVNKMTYSSPTHKKLFLEAVAEVFAPKAEEVEVALAETTPAVQPVESAPAVAAAPAVAEKVVEVAPVIPTAPEFIEITVQFPVGPKVITLQKTDDADKLDVYNNMGKSGIYQVSTGRYTYFHSAAHQDLIQNAIREALAEPTWTAPQPAVSTPDTCICLSCGRKFTRAEARRNGGDFSSSGYGECGC
jgi:hypothetical protein